MKIAVYCGSAVGNNRAYARDARAVGKWIGKNGHELIYGAGGQGLMGEVADAVLRNGGEVTGVIPNFKIMQEVKHPGLTRYIETEGMPERRSIMLEEADAYVALPGGPGTLDEFSEIMCLHRIGKNDKPLVLFDTEKFYRPFQGILMQMLNTGFADPGDFDHLLITDDVEKMGAFLTTGKK